MQINCCTEVPAFHLQGTMLKHIPIPTIFNIVLLAISLRMACYAALPGLGSVWAVLPVELLHGVTFACGWGASTVYASRVAPPGLSATMQVGGDGLCTSAAQSITCDGLHEKTLSYTTPLHSKLVVPVYVSAA